ncbi:unnamed protein product [Schistosoma spindalis]|nr:unnamed protein product [Schistosoma spindale]
MASKYEHFRSLTRDIRSYTVTSTVDSEWTQAFFKFVTFQFYERGGRQSVFVFYAICTQFGRLTEDILVETIFHPP